MVGDWVCLWVEVDRLTQMIRLKIQERGNNRQDQGLTLAEGEDGIKDCSLWIEEEYFLFSNLWE